MNPDKLLGLTILEALEKIKTITPVVEYSKIEDEEFINANELGFYLQSSGEGVVSSFRMFLEPHDGYFPIASEYQGDFKGIETLMELERYLGAPLQDIRSVAIPGVPPTLPGKLFIYKDKKVFAHYYPGKNNICFLHIEL